jgi:hypothetical protein
MFDIPSINVIKYDIGSCLTICHDKVFFNPGDQVIFEGPLYYFMEEIQSNEFMYVGSRVIICEWLYE